MKICFVSFEYPPSIIGGAGTYAEAMVNGLRKLGIEVYVVTRGEQDYCAGQTYGIRIHNMRYWQRFFFIDRTVKLLRRLETMLNFDVVHFNEPHILLQRQSVQNNGPQIICTFHSTQAYEFRSRVADLKTLKTTRDIYDLTIKNPVGMACDILTARSTDRIICPSPALANEISSYCMFDRRKISVVPNGIDLKTFDGEKGYHSAILDKYGLEKENYLLFMGRLSTLKGIQYLIQAFEMIKRDHATLKLAIVGTGDIGYFMSLASRTKGIVFTGHVRSLADRKFLCENSAVVVLPSLFEGLPMAILEAMACRKAVVASNVGGIPLLVKNGRNGFLVEPRKATGLEQSIKTLLEDSDLRMKMGFSGRQIVEERFTVEKMVNETVKIYREAH